MAFARLWVLNQPRYCFTQDCLLGWIFVFNFLHRQSCYCHSNVMSLAGMRVMPPKSNKLISCTSFVTNNNQINASPIPPHHITAADRQIVKKNQIKKEKLWFPSFRLFVILLSSVILFILLHYYLRNFKNMMKLILYIFKPNFGILLLYISIWF